MVSSCEHRLASPVQPVLCLRQEHVEGIRTEVWFAEILWYPKSDLKPEFEVRNMPGGLNVTGGYVRASGAQESSWAGCSSAHVRGWDREGSHTWLAVDSQPSTAQWTATSWALEREGGNGERGLPQGWGEF